MINLASSYFQGKIDDVSIVIGVLDIQGSVEEHLYALKKIGILTLSVKTKKALEKVDGLIIPGGESTTIGKLVKKYGFEKIIRKRVLEGSLSIWGTCAGAILLAKKVYHRPMKGLSLMNIEIERNAYGRQIDSFETHLFLPFLGEKKIPAVFIRAPKIKKASPKVQILAQYAGSPVMLRQKNILATMFHPELTQDLRIHKYFLSLVKHYATSKK